ncbi:N-acetyltransferase [Bifidobacterium primatium]|uniref:N-acetyltransferase n=3 Tax=Bifidobacterium TaxID=1678 RepID=A0A2M9HBW2_9BIFI|nr:N-acetyltransferase [Bifidobacterium sp. SMB2]NEH10523.1 N-acetyltransferase [Bifidobacterium saimiriisciurei]NEH10694.1 N-acetyltransferase [Bifidobacterium saimiriisciurei]PJM74292.1 N-acetyltransferase [Bifidobacterium primatium]
MVTSDSTPSTTRIVRTATAADFDVIQTMYARARKLMAENGNPTQWADRFPLESTVRADIAEGRTRLLVDHAGTDDDGNPGAERALAVFVLCPGPDPSYAEIDGAWLDDDDYMAVHRVAASGLGGHAGRDCLNWAVKHYGNVRMDTHRNNHGMQHVLESSGFTRCGVITLVRREGDAERLAYQRNDRR